MSHLIHDLNLHIIIKHVIHIFIVIQFNQSKKISEQYDLIFSTRNISIKYPINR